MKSSGNFNEGLLALARAEAATPEGRARVTRALRETLRELDADETHEASILTALDGLAAGLVIAADHAEFIALQARRIRPHSRRTG